MNLYNQTKISLFASAIVISVISNASDAITSASTSISTSVTASATTTTSATTSTSTAAASSTSASVGTSAATIADNRLKERIAANDAEILKLNEHNKALDESINNLQKGTFANEPSNQNLINQLQTQKNENTKKMDLIELSSRQSCLSATTLQDEFYNRCSKSLSQNELSNKVKDCADCIQKSSAIAQHNSLSNTVERAPASIDQRAATAEVR